MDTVLSKTMQQLSAITGGADITFYWARHTFVNIARKKIQIDKDSIAKP